METESNSRAVRINGEILVLHCWACGTAHCVNLELCVSGELTHMVCSNSNCRMSMFLVNEVIVDNESLGPVSKGELNPRSAAYSRFWK